MLIEGIDDSVIFVSFLLGFTIICFIFKYLKYKKIKKCNS